MIMLIFHARKNRIESTSLCAVLGLTLFALFFEGAATPSYSAETLMPSFGSGKVAVRLYTDYFCPPCRAMEPKIEPLIKELVDKNIIKLTLVDTPLYKFSPLYARYFLYILNEKKDFELALSARSVLIAAAVEKISDHRKLEEYLACRKIKFKPFDVRPTFTIINRHLKEDAIQSTPTCVIIEEGKSSTYTGGSDITHALERLKRNASKNPKKN